MAPAYHIDVPGVKEVSNLHALFGALFPLYQAAGIIA